MTFDYRPIRFDSIKRIDLPKHKISSKPWKNNIMNMPVSLIDRFFFGIDKDLEIYEKRFQAPVSSRYSENNVGWVRYYKASDENAVVVLPQRGYGYSFSQIIASYLATNGISAYEIETPLHNSRLPKGAKSICDIPLSIDDWKDNFKQAITETRGIIDSIKEDNIGIAGVSLGSIYSSVIYGVDDRVTSCGLLLGGGNLSDMILNSSDRLAKKLRDNTNGMSKQELTSRLEEIEPCNNIDKKKSGKLLMFTARNDKSVPEKYGEELRKAWGNPSYHSISAGHTSIAKNMRLILRQLFLHYKNNL